MKNDKKVRHLKNKHEKRTCSTLSFLNDENHPQIVSPGNKKLIQEKQVKEKETIKKSWYETMA